MIIMIISKMIWKHVSTTPLLEYVSYERRGAVTAHFRQESRYPVRKWLIYLQALTVPYKQLLLKRDRSRSHTSAV